MKKQDILKNQTFLAAIIYFLLVWIICFRFLIGNYLPLPLDNFLLIDKQKLADDKWTVKNSLVGDSSYQMYPWRKLIVDNYEKGILAPFNPYIILGNSLIGNGQSAPFYPGNIFFVFGFDTGWKILFFSKFFLAAFFTFLFLKTLRLSFYSSFLGGICFGFSGFVAAWDSWTTVGHTILWLPLMFLSISKWESDKKLRWLVIHGLSIFCSITAGFPQFALYSMIAVFCYFIFLGFKKAHTKKFWLLGISSFFWGLGLAALQLSPIISLLAISSRISQFKLVNLTGVPLENFMTFLVPGYFGWPNDIYYFGSQNFNETANYFGIIAFVLLLIALFTDLKNYIFWKLLFLISLLLIFHNPLSESLSNLHALIFGRGLSGRMFIITIFAGSVLAAKGLEKFLDNTQKGRVLLIISILATLMFGFKIAAALRYYLFPASLFVYRLEFISTQITIPAILLCLMFVIWLLKNYFNRNLVSVGVILIVLLDLLGLIFKVTPWSPATALTDPSVLKLKAQLSDDLLAKTIGFISIGENTLFGIPSFEGYDSIYPKTYLSFLKQNCGTDTENFTNWIYLDEVNCLPSLHKYGLKFIVDKNNHLIDELTKRWGKPRIDTDFELIDTQNNFSIYQSKNYKYPVEFSNAQGAVKYFTKKGAEYNLMIESPSDQQLTIALNYLDGWNAKINNISIRAWSDKNGFITMNIPSGNVKISLQYLPQSFQVGLIISLVSALTAVVFISLNRRFL